MGHPGFVRYPSFRGGSFDFARDDSFIGNFDEYA
jgi:hypothetical protein